MSRTLDGNKSFFKSEEDKNYMTQEHGRVAQSVLVKPYVSNQVVLSDFESGSTMLLGASGATSTIVLPMPKLGLQYRIVASADNSAHNSVMKSYTVAADGTRAIGNTIFYGILTAAGATPISLVGTAGLTIVASKLKKGDYINLVSDGTGWIVDAALITAAGITVA